MNTTIHRHAVRSIVAAMLGACAVSAGASAGVIVYQQDFETPSTVGWQLGGPGIDRTTELGNFSKRNTNNEITLTVNTMSNEMYTLVFDLFLFGEWSGDTSRWGANTISVRAEGHELFRETFSNTGVAGSQSYEGTPDLFGDLGYSKDADSAYRQIALEFSGRDPSVTLRIMGQGLGSMGQTSWSVDNVTVYQGSASQPAVPAPAGVAALGAAGLFVMRRRR
jgi:MYXO-CTERM domain-containing protein